MDEPLSNLDAKLREALRAELKDLQMKLGATFLFVTHDQVEAMSMGDKVAVLNDGHIAQIATPREIYSHPQNVFVASFVGSPPMNMVPGELRDGRVVALSGQLDLELQGSARDQLGRRSGPVTLGIRPENISVGLAAAVEGRVHHVENHGVEKIVTLRVDDHLLHATIPPMVRVAIDSPVRFSWDAAKLHLFDPDTGVNLTQVA
jgi:multiple sugar transport system ATP-binding protein